jgi:hypothetical protein
MLANVIFPALWTAYIASLFLPLAGLAALASEFLVFYLFQRPVRLSVLASAVVGANVFSWFAGLFITAFLPSGLVAQLTPSGREITTLGPDWGTLACLSFAVACVLSFVLELGILLPFRKKLGLKRLPACVGVANLASYAVLAGMLLLWPHLARA